jgi:hypothetical protein
MPRDEVFTEATGDHRELLVHIWYPSQKPGSAHGSYLPGAALLRKAGSASSLPNLFGPRWPSILSEEVKPHSFENAELGGTGRLPILIFSHGGGATSVAYTTQMEEFASHGYVVAGIEHTYDSPAVVFPDGRVVTSAIPYWETLRSATPDSESFERKVTEILAADVVFAIDKLKELSNDNSSMFHSRLDIDHIGVFGHSRGGRTAARACQLDRRIKACLNEDGNMFWQPFWLDEAGRSLEQPFMMLDHLDPELPDEVFAQMGTTREQYTQDRSARRAQAREKLYGTVRGGSYHVTLTTPGISHNSFLDVRLLGRPDSQQMNIWPKDVQAATPHERILRHATAFALAFFEKHVRGVGAATLLDSDNSRTADAEIQKFGAVR